MTIHKAKAAELLDIFYYCGSFYKKLLVRITGVEPARLTAIEPKSIVYAYFTISAFMPYFAYRASVPAISTVLVSSVSAVKFLIHFSSAICCTSDRWRILYIKRIRRSYISSRPKLQGTDLIA